MRIIESVAPSLSLDLVSLAVRSASEIEQSIDAFARQSGGSLLVFPTPFLNSDRNRIIARAELHRLPAIYPTRTYVTEGGLMSYGVDSAEMHRQAASYVDRIL